MGIIHILPQKLFNLSNQMLALAFFLHYLLCLFPGHLLRPVFDSVWPNLIPRREDPGNKVGFGHDFYVLVKMACDNLRLL